MKIILTAVIQNLGKIGDVVQVKSGYAKNFLIPQRKAICFTANNQKIFEAKKQQFEQENASKLGSAQSVKEAISGKDVVIIENASDDGRLYGSVNSAVIAAKINEILKQKAVSRAEIFLAKPIKEIGVYQVKLNLHSEVSFDLRLIVTRSESEIEALLKPEKKSKKSEGAESGLEGSAEVAAKSKKFRKPKKEDQEEEQVAQEE